MSSINDQSIIRDIFFVKDDDIVLYDGNYFLLYYSVLGHVQFLLRDLEDGPSPMDLRKKFDWIQLLYYNDQYYINFENIQAMYTRCCVAFNATKEMKKFAEQLNVFWCRKIKSNSIVFACPELLIDVVQSRFQLFSGDCDDMHYRCVYDTVNMCLWISEPVWIDCKMQKKMFTFGYSHYANLAKTLYEISPILCGLLMQNYLHTYIKCSQVGEISNLKLRSALYQIIKKEEPTINVFYTKTLSVYEEKINCLEQEIMEMKQLHPYLKSILVL